MCTIVMGPRRAANELPIEILNLSAGRHCLQFGGKDRWIRVLLLLTQDKPFANGCVYACVVPVAADCERQVLLSLLYAKYHTQFGI